MFQFSKLSEKFPSGFLITNTKSISGGVKNFTVGQIIGRKKLSWVNRKIPWFPISESESRGEGFPHCIVQVIGSCFHFTNYPEFLFTYFQFPISESKSQGGVGFHRKSGCFHLTKQSQYEDFQFLRVREMRPGVLFQEQWYIYLFSNINYLLSVLRV